MDWYPWGEEALSRARADGQADPALDRLRGLPLVPCDGARVVRGPGDRRADERALRQHQGGPRGAPRPRHDLHGGGAGDHRAGRLADDRLPDARTASRSTAGRTSRPSRATACPPSAPSSPRVADAYRRASATTSRRTPPRCASDLQRGFQFAGTARATRRSTPRRSTRRWTPRHGVRLGHMAASAARRSSRSR